ncbi:hypothetical protein GQ55_9G591600 [Panicum hallii var. hallii]|uniref:Uncharacterized protein n=1 Tax=Panicum hallii var. hallii TaxID=1504633 RepID=A0A2T7CH23_9POAL|nr:hypothetical protein GQ55_9G591600 [Panicum hallii var. hallii]
MNLPAPAWSTVSLPNTRGGQAGNPTCADGGRVRARVHDRTSAVGHRRPEQPKPSQAAEASGRADRPSAATRTTHRLPPRAVGRRSRRDPLSPAPARRRVPGVSKCERLLSGWVGFGRGRGPPCQGRLAAVGRPAPATSAAYYAAARLG